MTDYKLLTVERQARALFEEMALIADDEKCIQILAKALAAAPAVQKGPLRHPTTPGYLEYPSFEESADFDPAPPAQNDHARLIEKAFELATANGHTYQYEGWGGRYKTRRIGPDEYRKNLLERAAHEIQARTTFGGPQRFTTAGQQEPSYDNQ